MTSAAKGLTPAESDEQKHAKRLQPKPEVLRELYMLSGNLCALPDCPQLLIGETFDYLGEVAHIHAASDNGPRAKRSLSDEQRREAWNLMLLCPTCHKKIDKSPGRFPAEKLFDWKKLHEGRYRRGIDLMMERSVGDVTKDVAWTPATTLARTSSSWGWGTFAPSELAEHLGYLESLADRLGAVPHSARTLLAIMIRHGATVSGQGYMQIEWPTVIEHSDKSPARTRDLVHVLIAKRFVEDTKEDRVLSVSSFPDGELSFFTELKKYDPELIDPIICDLNFSVLD